MIPFSKHFKFTENLSNFLKIPKEIYAKQISPQINCKTLAKFYPKKENFPTISQRKTIQSLIVHNYKL